MILLEGHYSASRAVALQLNSHFEGTVISSVAHISASAIRIHKYGLSSKHSSKSHAAIKMGTFEQDQRTEVNDIGVEKRNRWVGAFHIVRPKRTAEHRRRKFQIVTRNSYKLKTDRDAKSALGLIATGVKKLFEKLKEKGAPKP